MEGDLPERIPVGPFQEAFAIDFFGFDFAGFTVVFDGPGQIMATIPELKFEISISPLRLFQPCESSSSP